MRTLTLTMAGTMVLVSTIATAQAPFVDHFECYKSKPARGSVKFAGVAGLNLADRFETGDFDLVKARELCVPADKEGEGIDDATTHLEGYLLRATDSTPDHVPLVNFRVVDQFGELFLTTIKPRSLLVPTLKDLSMPVPAPPNPLAHDVDHFKCYKVKKPKGFQPITGVAVVDQFAQPKLYDLKKPAALCAPVDKAGEGIKEEESFLTCYSAKPAKDEPKHVPVEGIYLNNQLGPEQIDTKVESTLCVPTLVVQGCGDGLVNEPSEQCDDGNEVDGDGCSSTCQSELPFTIEIANLNILQNITVGNIGYDELVDRVTLLADEIAVTQPDIATFQEVVLGNAMDQLVDDLSTRYGLQYFAAEYGVLSGNSLISRWPASLEETALIPDLDLVPSFPDRRFTGRIRVDSPIGALDVYPMHICAFCSMAERSVHTQAFLDFVAATHVSGHPAIVGADFNAHTGTAPDGQPTNDPPIDLLQGAGWVSLFDGFDAPCLPPADRNGCTSGITDLTRPEDTTDHRIDNIMIVPAAAPPFGGAISQATETGPTGRFAATPLLDPNPKCHFDPRILCSGPTCPAGATCHPNGFCVRTTPIACAANVDCPGDIAPEACRTTLWVSDHLGVQSTIELVPAP